MQRVTLVAVVALATVIANVNGHGRLVQPAGRATLWRYDEFKQFNPLPDYDDTQAFCGGFYVQYSLNEGKCGICGDPWDEVPPRAHEGGGRYGRGIITGNYTAGEEIEVKVDLTASHLGYFEFRLCVQNNPLVPATQECLDENVLQLADGSGTRFPIKNFDKTVYAIRVVLPQNVTCRQCVLQWHYNAGNSHGYCQDGSYELGCGDQETFRSCADIAIR